MNLELSGEIFYWRGPAPHHFVRVPPELCDDLRIVARQVTYGWGMIPVTARIGHTEWQTSLFPKDGGYLVPIRASVQRAENLAAGDTVTLRLAVAV